MKKNRLALAPLFFISFFIKGTENNLSPTDAALAADFSSQELLYIGSIYKKAGLYTAAQKYLSVALTLQPTNSAANWEIGDVELIQGDFTDGFPHYKYRWFDNPQLTVNLWNHEPLHGKKVLIRYQWDIIYDIHFLRYVSMLKSQGAFIALELPAQYHPLFADNNEIDLFINPGTPYNFDYQIPITYLPELFGTTVQTIPNKVPYFTLDPVDNQPFQKELVANSIRVAVYLEGHYFDQGPNPRYIPVSLLESLADIPGATVYSLSAKPTDEPNPSNGYSYRFCKRQILFDYSNDYESCTGVTGDSFVYVDQYLQGTEPLVQLGSAMQYMDLIITDNTTIGALAGALGISTFIILPVVNDWFWLLKRSDSPWYPTVRLFRQKSFTRWHDVAEEVVEAAAIYVQTLQDICIQQS